MSEIHSKRLKVPVWFVVTILLYVSYLFLEFKVRLNFYEVDENNIYIFALKLVLLLIWTLFIFKNYFSLTTRKDLFIKVIVFWCVYLFFTNTFHANTFWDLVALAYKVLFWPFSILFGYLFFLRYAFISDKFFNIILVCFTVLILLYIYFFSKEYVVSNFDRIESRTTFNVSYFFLLLLPWFFYIKKPWLRLLFVLLLLAPVLLSVKRTAILGFFIATLVGYSCEVLFLKGKARNKFIMYFIVALILASFLLFFINEFSSGWIFHRFNSISEDRGTYRLDIYSRLYELLMDSSILELVVGHGHNSVKNYMFEGLSAHNDWFECFFDYGIIGFVIYVYINILVLKKGVQLYRDKSRFAPIIFSSYSIFFIMSLTSHLIMYPYLFIIITFLWGAIFGLSQYKSKKSIISN